MKQAVVIFLTSLIVLTSSPLGQGFDLFFKSIAFVHHFLHHISCQDEDIGLGDFVHLHYHHDSKHHEEDHAEHDKLPFSRHHYETNTVALILYKHAVEWENSQASVVYEKHKFNYQTPAQLPADTNIWKPPRFAI